MTLIVSIHVIVTYMGVAIRRGLDWLIGFIALIHATLNYK
jgi:hypothetical protein